MTTYLRRKANPVGLRLENAASGLIAAWAIFSSGSAHAETQISANTSIKSEIASNPYLLGGTQTSATSIALSLTPQLSFEDGVKSIKVTGDIRHTQFSRRYNSTDDFRVNAGLSEKLSPTLSYNAGIGFESSVVGANDLLAIDQASGGGGVSPPLPTDIALNGLRQRRQAINGNLNLGYTPSARDRWQFQGGFSFTKYPQGSSASEYNSASGSIGYNRTLNGRTSIGINVGVSRVDYRRTLIGDATTISPQATFTTRLGAGWNLTASAGISHSSVRGPLGYSGRNSASGSVNVCKNGDRGRFCVFATRSVQASSFGGGVRPQTSFGASYNFRLDSLSTIDASANYSRTAQSIFGVGQSSQYGRASLVYNRRLTRNLQASFGANYADSFRDIVQRRANIAANVSLSYSFGGMR